MNSPDAHLSLAHALAHWPTDQIACFDDDTPVTYGQWLEQSQRVAALIQRCGIGAGDRVALWLPNGQSFLNAFAACAQLGAIAIAVNTRFKSHELQDILERSGVTMLITDLDFEPVDFAALLQECDFARLTALHWLVNAGTNTRSSTESISASFSESVSAISMSQANEVRALTVHSGKSDSPCIMFTTSGTTSKPKFVLHDQQTLLSHGQEVAQSFGLTQDSRILLAPPLCGVFGLCHVTAAISAGCPLIMRPIWNATQAAADINAHAVTHLNATDDAWLALLETNTAKPAFASLKFGGFAAFNPALANITETANNRGVTLVGLYGTSEIQALFARQPEGLDPAQRALAGGKPISPSARVRTRDPQSANLLGHNEHGELEFLAPNSRMCAYYGDEKATSQAFTDDNWYRSGDLGYTVTDDNFVYLERIGDAMRLGGFLTSPLEIEHHIQQFDGIKACQVVRVTTEAGDRAFAWVITTREADLDESAVTAFLSPRLARYKLPVRIVAIDAFPVTEGTNAVKIQKSHLRANAQALIDEQV